MLRRRLATICVALWAAGSAPAVAQDFGVVRSPVLVVESERLYQDSAFGQRVDAEIAALSADLSAENRRIEAELEAEEKALTEQRPGLDPDVFRDMADAFDTKVRALRRDQEAKARAILRKRELGQQGFLAAAAPVLEMMMREAGAVVVLERQEVFLSLSAIDITQDAIARINAEIGDGTTSPEDEAVQTPDTDR